MRPEPQDFIDQPWHSLYFRAFEALRFDRTYGALGGASPIPYMARARYADDIGLIGDDRQMFMQLFTVVDDEFLDWRSATEKAA